jgi:hypothetical protein
MGGMVIFGQHFLLFVFYCHQSADTKQPKCASYFQEITGLTDLVLHHVKIKRAHTNRLVVSYYH